MPDPSASVAETVLSLLHAHRSIRDYAPEAIDDATIARAVCAAQMASTSSNVQAYCLLQVTDPEKRRQLAELAGGQAQVATAGAFFVVCGDCRRHALICEREGGPCETNFETFLVATIDAALFAQNLAVAFEAMGYGMCYIGGLRNDLPAVDRLLELPRHVFPYFGLCVGRPAAKPDTKPRLPVEAVWFKDAYPGDAEMLERVGEYDARMTAYYEERIGKRRDWSTAIRRLRGQRKREELADYYRGKGAALK